MLLPVVCPLLITPGQCAEFVYKESEDLADLQAITPPSEQHHRLHLSLWSVSKKPQSRLRKPSERTHLSAGSLNDLPIQPYQCVDMLLPDSLQSGSGLSRMSVNVSCSTH